MDRTKFFNEVVVDGIKELDFLDNTLTGFSMTRSPVYYRVRDVDVLSPDLISYKAYKREDYWWIICLVNNIIDVSSDLYVGLVLKIPNILDIYDFAKKYRRRS